MAQKRRKRSGGILAEHLLIKYLGYQQVRCGTSQMLDHVHKIDALVHEIKPIAGFLEPIALQVTQKRDDLEKIRTFFERARKATKGPLLFAELDGRVTASMAAGVRNALAALWLEVPRNQALEHRIVVHANGQYEWLPPLPKSRAPAGKIGRNRRKT